MHSLIAGTIHSVQRQQLTSFLNHIGVLGLHSYTDGIAFILDRLLCLFVIYANNLGYNMVCSHYT